MKIDARFFLDFLSENVSALAEKCQPQWHPLGFVSCVIKEEKDNFTARLHYWPDNERRVKKPDWPIHTHSYALSSLILFGSVRDIQYQRMVGTDYSIYKVKYFNGGSEILNTDERTSLYPVCDKTRQCAEQYAIEPGIFHQSLVDFDTSALTLVAHSYFSSEAPLVLGNSEETRHPYEHAAFDRELFWEKVKVGLGNYASHYSSGA